MSIRQIVFEKGEVIFSEGERGSTAFLIKSGRVEISRCIDGEQVVLGMLDGNAVFGEMALIEDKPRMATARATEQATCLVIPRLAFKEKLDNLDPFVRGLLRLLSSNLRSVTERYLAQTSADVPETEDAVSTDVP
jgi:CRP/FNR family transcriptional regulator, cyclic AMP receptor protein